MFHFLPDVILPKRIKLIGSLFVAAMLLLGKYGIGIYIANSELSELGGASASIFVLMLWIYYTSIILFYGAEVIRAIAEHEGLTLCPRRYANRIRVVVVGEDDAVSPEQQQPQTAAQSGKKPIGTRNTADDARGMPDRSGQKDQ